MAIAWDRPEEYDHLTVVADDERLHRQSILERLEAVPGRARAAALGSYPRFRVIEAGDGDEALQRVTSEVSALAIDLVMPRRNGLEVIELLRERRPDLAILAFTAGAPPSEAVAAMMAGADHFLEYVGGEAIEHALELAIDRRRLSRLIERSEADVDEARQRLARLGGSLALGLPGLRPPPSADAVVPFHEAARRYVAACAKLFEGDPNGLAQRLGLSYSALRRLLKRYGVPFPGRSWKSASGERQTGSPALRVLDTLLAESAKLFGGFRQNQATSRAIPRQELDNMAGLADKFAVNLKNERLRKKLSQEALAAKAGLSVSYISMLERGQRTPPLDTLESLAKALSVSATSLLS